MTHYKKSCLNTLIMGMLFLCLFSLAGVSQARPLISEQEQASLQRILYELNASNEILLEAQRTADKQDRFRFAYHCLVTDINLVKSYSQRQDMRINNIKHGLTTPY